MALQRIGYVDLPPHANSGGFDHAAVHSGTGRVYVAHTANDAVDVIDGENRRYVASIHDLGAVAGALVSEDHDLVFTSNRGENTVGIFAPADSPAVTKVGVGVRPNGLAYAPEVNLLLAANVGDPGVPGSFTVSLVDVRSRKLVSEVPVLGRTRWPVYDSVSQAFYVNIADPPQIAVVDGRRHRIARTITIPAAGPHGLDIDGEGRRLFCACDGKALIELDVDSGDVLRIAELGGVPDVIFFNRRRRRLYVAIGDPGLIEVFDTDEWRKCETIPTERGAHTIGFDAARDVVYAFLPETHRAAVFLDRAA